MYQPVGHAGTAQVKSPAFAHREWNGWGLTGISILSFIVFVLCQGVASFAVLVTLYPGIARLQISPTLLHLLRSRDVAFWSGIFSAPHLLVITAVGHGALAAAVIGLCALAFRNPIQKLGLAEPPSGRLWSVGLLAGFAFSVIATILGNVQAKLFGPHPELIAQILTTRHGLPSFAADLIAVAAFVPFAEEVLFRGVIFAGMVQRMPLPLAAVLSGIIFGVLHFDLWNVVPLAAIGIGLAYLYYQTRNLWASVVAHAAVNTISLVLAYLFPQLAK